MNNPRGILDRSLMLKRCPTLFGFMLVLMMVKPAYTEQVFQLQNGMVVIGSKAEIATLKEGFGASTTTQLTSRPIWLIEDGLRRHYFHGKGMVSVPPIDKPNLDQRIDFWQPIPLGGKSVGGLGSVLGVSPFNEFGRRLLQIRGPTGPVKVIQGITELNPRYAVLSALKPPQGQPSLLWEMRVATSTMDSSTLDAFFKTQFDETDLNARLEIVRFYISADRFGDAKRALQQTIIDFPEETDLPKQVLALTERQASQLLDEAKIRNKAGQHRLAARILDNFPVKDVGRITRLQVQDARKEIETSGLEAARLTGLLTEQVAQLAAADQGKLKAIVQEISEGLSADTLSRLSDYSRLGESETIALDNRVALAISGWLMGAGAGEQNLSVVTSLVQVRDLVADYLGTDDRNRHQAILDQLRSLEGAQAEYIDKMLPLLVPTRSWPEGSASDRVEGMHSVQTDLAEYVIQLPPEYNPLRSYPCLIALHPARSDHAAQIDWWSGGVGSVTQQLDDQLNDEQAEGGLASRLGHASRHGFIVVAPRWSRPAQRRYEYTPAEHERVLAAMRDAMRRCSIDSDRVFLAGQGEGGTAAWDIALAHPDLWAGLIAISATPDKTVHHYEPNSRYVPMYLVMGELDGSRASGGIMDDYMSYKHDALVVMYRGRGREYFYEETPRFFEWMSSSAHVRRPIPREFEANMIRQGDQFFWWVELLDLKPGTAIDPILWDDAPKIRSKPVEGTINEGNQIRFKAPADRVRLLLRPQAGLDLNREIVVHYGSRTIRHNYDGNLETILEDARRRADRKRAVWLEITIP
ncbi:Alpha/beta hydrolase family protein [Rubripirellula amarantea]|uniref:Alpha/beta hydrolase family protein n=1 Tax=Rubripirellula amarantea TaxID=2527999 RepID=A0A5C5WQ63_9BACT|nr:alpha/beta hydrolase [Rubripirellula amarantea]TWT53024.1 Alpha/beta hydrolase family protein [Rubripirellula amarantea]